MTDELKPCPFCGVIHKWETITDIHFGKHEAIICRGIVILSAYTQHAKDHMTEFWNDRPIEDTLNARIAELRRIHFLEVEYLKRREMISDDELKELQQDVSPGQVLFYRLENGLAHIRIVDIIQILLDARSDNTRKDARIAELKKDLAEAREAIREITKTDGDRIAELEKPNAETVKLKQLNERDYLMYRDEQQRRVRLEKQNAEMRRASEIADRGGVTC